MSSQMFGMSSNYVLVDFFSFFKFCMTKERKERKKIEKEMRNGKNVVASKKKINIGRNEMA